MELKKKEKLEEAFRQAEGSTALEGLTLTEPYWALKTRVLAGEISPDEMSAEIVADAKAKAKSGLTLDEWIQQGNQRLAEHIP